MTTTINRQITLFVQGIFKKYGIDNLQLEIDLVSGLQRMWVEGGKDPIKLAALREEMLSAMLVQGAYQNELAEMEGRVKASMGLHLDGRSRYEDMLKFLVKKDKEGETVEQFAKWCRENPYDAPKFFKIAEKPELLMVNWPAAFQSANESHRPEHVRFTGGEDVSSPIPNPYKKPAILQRQTSSDISGSNEVV